MWIIHVFMKKCSRKKNSQKFKMTVKIYGPPGSDSVAEKPYGPTGGPPPKLWARSAPAGVQFLPKFSY